MKARAKATIGPLSRPNSEINVTPLVDVVLVLLIIFMVVTPLLEKDIGVRIPATEQAAPPTDVPPDQLVVHLGADGQLDVDGDKVTSDGYVAALGARLEKRADKTVFFVADDRAPYPSMVHMLDGARQAGAVTLGMGTEPATTP